MVPQHNVELEVGGAEGVVDLRLARIGSRISERGEHPQPR